MRGWRRHSSATSRSNGDDYSVVEFRPTGTNPYSDPGNVYAWPSPGGFGTGSDFDLDTMTYGIIATASNSPGYEFTNLRVETNPIAQAAVQLRAGGSIAPNVLVNGGSVGGSGFALGPFPTPAAGHLTAVYVVGYNIP